MADDSISSIYLKLSGDQITPTNVRMGMLFGVLGGLERAIEAMAEDLGIEFDENEAILVPERIEKSSLGISGVINHKARDPLQHIDRAFYAHEIETLPSSVRSEFQDIQSTLASRSVKMEMRSKNLGLHGLILTEDKPHIPKTPEDNDEMTSHAVVYGTCIRVNRTNSDARIELHDGTGCTIKGLTDDHIRTLMKKTGENLEQVYRIEGQATWSLGNYRISQIDVVSIQSVERNAKELFSALRKATGDTFDDLDPIDYVNELRGK